MHISYHKDRSGSSPVNLDKPYGLSLLELIIAIAVIALLGSILLITVRASIERSERIGCVSNLRSLYQGLMLYSNDYNGRLPFGERDPDVTEINANYYHGEYAKELSYYLPGGSGANTGHVDPYLCPTDQETRAGAGRGFLGHSYGVNMTLCRENSNGIPYSQVSTWLYPSRTFLLADSTGPVISRSSPASNLAARHGGGANTLFLDGSVKWIPSPFPNWTEDRGFWVPDFIPPP